MVDGLRKFGCEVASVLTRGRKRAILLSHAGLVGSA